MENFRSTNFLNQLAQDADLATWGVPIFAWLPVQEKDILELHFAVGRGQVVPRQ